MAQQVTPEEVKAAVLATGKSWFEIRQCSICGSGIGYGIACNANECAPFFDGSCGCASGYAQRRDWSDLSGLINMQSEQKWRDHFRQLFGMEKEP